MENGEQKNIFDHFSSYKTIINYPKAVIGHSPIFLTIFYGKFHQKKLFTMSGIFFCNPFDFLSVLLTFCNNRKNQK